MVNGNPIFQKHPRGVSENGRNPMYGNAHVMMINRWVLAITVPISRKLIPCMVWVWGMGLTKHYQFEKQQTIGPWRTAISMKCSQQSKAIWRGGKGWQGNGGNQHRTISRMYIVDIADGIDAAHYVLSMLWRLLGSFGDIYIYIWLDSPPTCSFDFTLYFRELAVFFYHQIIEWICKTSCAYSHGMSWAFLTLKSLKSLNSVLKSSCL